MNADIHLEHRASSSQGKHEGEPSLGLCDRLNRTRDNSQRQLPTDHDYAVSTREYQTDQSSLKTAPTAARSVFGKGKQRQRQKQPHCCAELTRSLHISGKRTRRGGITKTGNAHLRRIVVEAAWSYRRPPAIWYGLRRRQESISEQTKEIAWKAQHRLHKRYMKLGAAGKDQRKIVTAVARELLGFIWAIGTRAETVVSQQVAA